MNVRDLVPALLVLTATGCGDLLSLEEKPQTFLSESQFYRNAADAEAALLAAYAPMATLGYYARDWLVTIESMTDYMNGRGSFEAGAGYNWSQQSMDRAWNGWSQMYRSINNANLVIDRVPSISMNESRKQVIIGEAHFLRALNYLNLVRFWGAVPLRLEPAAGLESLSAPRAPVEEVYSLIFADLNHAVQALPEVADNGRPGRWAATALLADAHLGRGEWSQAAARAREVIDSGRFSLVRPTAPEGFEEIFGADVDRSPEEIFDISFTRAVGFGLEWPSTLAGPTTGHAPRPVYGLFAQAGAEWLFTWDRDDLRHDFNLYVGEDVRDLTPAWPQLFKKFRDPEGPDRNGNGNDFPILRYADILLMHSEATANEAGAPTAASYEALNQVRRRAYGLPLEQPAPGVDVPAGLDLEGFLDVLIHERAYEFLVEGKRYWDLKRTGRLEAAIRAAGKTYDPKYMLFPLPRTELDSNEALTFGDQNPGW